MDGQSIISCVVWFIFIVLVIAEHWLQSQLPKFGQKKPD
jgi:hypothetical protein